MSKFKTPSGASPSEWIRAVGDGPSLMSEGVCSNLAINRSPDAGQQKKATGFWACGFLSQARGLEWERTLLAVNVLRAVGFPGRAEVVCIFVIAWTYAHQNATVTNAFVVLFHALFRHIPAN